MEKGNIIYDENDKPKFVPDENGRWTMHKVKSEETPYWKAGIDPYAEKDLKRVYVTQDQDSHWYIIPIEMLEVFNRLLEESQYESNPDWEAKEAEFIDKFSQYATGGYINNIELYARI